MNLDEPYDVIAATFAREGGADLALEALQQVGKTELPAINKFSTP